MTTKSQSIYYLFPSLETLRHLDCEEEANFCANLESFEFLGSAGNLNRLVGSWTDILNSKFMTLDAAQLLL